MTLPVLVTGGAGYIGSHAVLALVDCGWPVTVIDNLSTGFEWAIPDGVTLYRGDIADTDLLARIFAEQGTQAILHFAGSIIVPESVEKPLKYYDNNTAKSRTLIEAAVNAGVPHFIFSSTATVYGEPELKPLTEDDPLTPVNPYGMSKLMTERILADVSRAHAMNHCVLRYFNVAGADPTGRSGQVGKGSTHLIKVAVEAAVGKRERVAVYGTDETVSAKLSQIISEGAGEIIAHPMFISGQDNRGQTEHFLDVVARANKLAGVPA